MDRKQQSATVIFLYKKDPIPLLALGGFAYQDSFIKAFPYSSILSSPSPPLRPVETKIDLGPNGDAPFLSCLSELDVCVCVCVCAACEICQRRDVAMIRCGACECAQYCSAECQRIAWPIHRKYCTGTSVPARRRSRSRSPLRPLPRTRSRSPRQERPKLAPRQERPKYERPKLAASWLLSVAEV